MNSYTHSIAAGALEMGIALSDQQAEALSTHLRLVLETNETMNLTSIAPDEAVVLHVLDSLTAVPALESAPGGPFADIGSGAGYPGVPLTIQSGRSVALVESVCKKAAFLERVVAELRLDATVHPVRAEELALERPGGFAAVTARALSSLPSLIELAAPLLTRGGLLVAMKGRVDGDELSRGDEAAAMCGLERCRMDRPTLPGTDAARTVVVYRSVKAPSVRLPRRNGMAQRQPLT
jgi:16S rRNA (guanine527-N7)-methyltransferase